MHSKSRQCRCDATPACGMYKVLANINCISLDEVPLSNDFQLVTKDILNRISSRTKAIFLCSPNLIQVGIRFIGQIFCLYFNRLTDLLLVVDEAYIDFSTQTSIVAGDCHTVQQSYHYPNPFQGLSWAGRNSAWFLPWPVKRLSIFSTKSNPHIISVHTAQERAISALQDWDATQEQITQLIAERKRLSAQLRGDFFC